MGIIHDLYKKSQEVGVNWYDFKNDESVKLEFAKNQKKKYPLGILRRKKDITEIIVTRINSKKDITEEIYEINSVINKGKNVTQKYFEELILEEPETMRAIKNIFKKGRDEESKYIGDLEGKIKKYLNRKSRYNNNLRDRFKIKKENNSEDKSPVKSNTEASKVHVKSNAEDEEKSI